MVYGRLGGGAMHMPRNWPLTVRGYHDVHLSGTAEGRRRVNAFLHAGVRDGSLRPVVGGVFQGLERMADAHRLPESDTHFGKVVVTVDHGSPGR